MNPKYCYLISHFCLCCFLSLSALVVFNFGNKLMIYCIYSCSIPNMMSFLCCFYINLLLLIIAVVLLYRRLDLAIKTFAHTSDSVFSRAPSVWLIVKMSYRTCYNEMVVRLKIENKFTENVCRKSKYKENEFQFDARIAALPSFFFVFLFRIQLTCMNSTMIFHMVSQFEGFAAELTLEWAIAGVNG